MTGAQLVVAALKQQGIKTVFGYPGGAIMPIYDALYDGGVEHILCRHEQGAAMAAIGMARSTQKVAVCMATSGPGATNLVTGLADAFLDSVPLVAITRPSGQLTHRHRCVSRDGCDRHVALLYQAQLLSHRHQRASTHVSRSV